MPRMSKNLPRWLELISSLVKALRSAIRLDNFRLAQHLRMGLAAYLRDLEQPLQDDVARLRIPLLFLAHSERRVARTRGGLSRSPCRRPSMMCLRRRPTRAH